MAKISAIIKNQKRIKKVISSFENRAALREINKNGTFEEQQVAQKKLQKTRNSSYTRVRNRCSACGRPRGTLKKFGLCRICLRNAVMRGEVPGVRKASW